MRKSINIIGAFDRYNYGDVLFPLIIEEYLRKYEIKVFDEYNLQFYALRESNLESIGGKKTKALRLLYENKIDYNSVILIAGGDVLASRIGDLDIDLSNRWIDMIIKKSIRKIIGMNNYEKIIKNKYGLVSSFPWVINKNNFKNNVSILYNTVGGSTIDRLKINEQVEVLDYLKNADYISVRDKKTKSNLNDINAQLIPDSAIIMSEIFSLDKLKEKISDNIKNFVANNKKKYICIQTNNWSIDNGNDILLVEEIKKILKNEDGIVLLLPIGMAANHDDKIALKKIYKNINDNRVYFFNKLNVFDIMYCIANCKFFAGTSLHGNITAMSYGVKHIGLNKKITKLDEFLKTWEIKEQNKCINFNELYSWYMKSKNINDDLIEGNRKNLIRLALGNFNNMFAKLNLEK